MLLRDRTLLVVVAAGLLGALIFSFLPGLNGDVQYVLGGLRATEGHESFVTTFVHRPLAYRAFMAASDGLVGIVGLGPDRLRTFEAAVRLVGIAVAVAAAGVLWGGLRRLQGQATAGAVAISVGVALAIPPAWDFLQAESLAVGCVAVAVGMAIWPRRGMIAGALSGFFAVLAVALKISTVTYLPLAIVLVALLHRRRALAMAAGAMGWLVLWVAGMVWLVPLEWQWVGDMSRLGRNNLLTAGFDLLDLQFLGHALSAKTLLQPWMIAVPAAVVLLARTAGPTAQSRRAVAGLATLALGLSLAPLVLQGQYSLYHAAALPIVGAGLLAAGAARWWEATGRFPARTLLPIPAFALAAAATLALPAETRVALDVPVLIGLIAGSLALAWSAATEPVLRLDGARGSTAGRPTLLLAGLVLLLLPAVAPSSAWSVNPILTPYTNASWAEKSQLTSRQMDRLRLQIGAGSPVLYLTYGDIGYHLGNRTDCRYPSPLWLQRGMTVDHVLAFPSYPDNVACVDSPQPRWLVIAPGWFEMRKLQPPIRARIDAAYDCAASVTAGGIVACPRRATAAD